MSASRNGTLILVLASLLGCSMLPLAAAPPALADAGTAWWALNTTAAPSYLPHEGKAQIAITASNLGDGEVDTAGEPVTLTDELPEGLTAEAVELTASPHGSGKEASCQLEGPRLLICSTTESLAPYERLLMRITVSTAISGSGRSTLSDTVRVQGGHTPSASLTKTLTVEDQPTPFGVESYEMTAEGPEEPPRAGGQGWTLDTQAGSHPFQLTTTLDFNQTLATYSPPQKCPQELTSCVLPSAPALARNLHFRLPVGLVGDPGATAHCSDTDFAVNAGNGIDLCAANTAVGVATVLVNDPLIVGYQSLAVPVFNLEPAPGEPARFGFDVENVPVVLKTAVPAGGEYAIEVSVANASQAVQVLTSQVTLWGVPGDPRHDTSRGWGCLGDGWWEYGHEPPIRCQPQDQQQPPAFLTLPSSCQQRPTTSVGGQSWPAGETQAVSTIEGEHTTYSFATALTGCGALPFKPALSLQPETGQASTPAGVNVTLTMPQTGTLSGSQGALAESDIKDTTVEFPEGLELNPSAANGLQACPALAFGYTATPEADQTSNLSFTQEKPACPNASTLGTVTIETPLLPGQQLNGSVYLAEQNTDPFKAPLAIYLTAEDPTAGILVKLAGTVIPLPNGRLISTFENTPQLPFSTLILHLFGGQDASLTTPSRCTSYAASTSFTGWAGQTTSPESQPAFQITQGQGGGPCPGTTLGFAPSFTAGARNPHAGALTPFTITIANPDGDQPLARIDVHLPDGIAALISQVAPCPEDQALADTCGPESLVGHLTATAGVGDQPITLPGELYLTGPLKATAYHPAAPFGLLAVTHAAAGPFSLGNILTLSALEIDPSTAAVTVQSEPIPELIDGVPVDLKELQVTIERPGDEPFQFNPTSCEPMSVTGTLTGYEGTSTQVPYPFQVTGCQSLPFTPELAATVRGHASKADGTGLTVKIISRGLGVADIRKVDLQLPQALPSRDSTLNKACLAAVFEANPAGCGGESVIGYATVHTPVLRDALSGPAYLVSHGGAAFPDVEFVLQGEGITLILDGKTQIKDGITYSRFETAPDEPFTSFETVLPAGPHSILSAYANAKEPYDLCATNLTMPTVITAQDGAVIEQDTKIVPEGCGAVSGYKVKLTRTQQLAKALTACRQKYQKAERKRAACEASAHKRYDPPKKTQGRARNAGRHHA